MARLPRHGADQLSGLVVLGATGSIGRQTLEVAGRLGLDVVGIAARRASPELVALAAAWPDATVVAADAAADTADLAAHPGATAVGPDALLELSATPNVVVVNGVVGAAGLAPSLAAVRAGNRLALANKESLVAGGRLLLGEAQRCGAEIIPVDSEHSAIWQCLLGEPPAAVRRIVLTASGGPFRGASRRDLSAVTPQQALAHPTWDMGARISIDSATMLNKALEVIEAHHLFGVPYDAIAVLVHPQSIVHSMVEFVDGSVKAQMGEPDMRVPIQYAITVPARAEAPVSLLDLSGRSLTFETPDLEAFPCLRLGYEAGRRGGLAPAALNAADEIAVAAFLDGRIGFLDIPNTLEAVLEQTPDGEAADVADVLQADAAARGCARRIIAARSTP